MLNSILSFVYAVLGFGALGFISKAMYDQKRLKSIVQDQKNKEALDEATKAIASLSDDQLDANIRKYTDH
jgi:hypothetical protein